MSATMLTDPCLGDCGSGNLDQWFHGKPSVFVFHNLEDVEAVVTGFWEGLFSLLDVFFIDVKFLDTGVFPDKRFEAKGKSGVGGVILQFEGTGNGDFVHGDSFDHLSDFVWDVGTERRPDREWSRSGSCCRSTEALLPFQE